MKIQKKKLFLRGGVGGWGDGGVGGPIRGWGGGSSKVWGRWVIKGYGGCKPRRKGIDKCI